MKTKQYNWLLCVALLWGACEEGATEPEPEPEKNDAEVRGGDAGATESDGGALDPLDDPDHPVFAVHLRGEDAAGVALLNGKGELIDERFIDSGSVAPKLSALFTDIWISAPVVEEGVLAIVARTPNDAFLRVSLDDGEISSNFSTQLPVGDGSSFSSNPQDYLYLDEDTAWVSRYAPNLDPDAPEMNQGDDLIKLEPTTGELLSRVSLEDFHETVDYELVDRATGDTTPMTGTAYARPGDLVRVGDYAFVGLGRLTIDFSGQADGAVALLDLAEETVSGHDLDGLGNCGSLIPVVGRDDAVIVSCVGVPWGSPDSAGVVLLSVDDSGEVQEEQRFTPKEDGPLAVFFPISLGGNEVVVAESGWATGGNDKLFRLDLKKGSLERFYEADESGVMGFSGGYRPDTKRLLVGDRTEGETGVRRFRMGSEIEELSMIELDNSLPVDGVRSLIAF